MRIISQQLVNVSTVKSVKCKTNIMNNYVDEKTQSNLFLMLFFLERISKRLGLIANLL